MELQAQVDMWTFFLGFSSIFLGFSSIYFGIQVSSAGLLCMQV